jgi:hypothetical protein
MVTIFGSKRYSPEILIRRDATLIVALADEEGQFLEGAPEIAVREKLGKSTRVLSDKASYGSARSSTPSRGRVFNCSKNRDCVVWPDQVNYFIEVIIFKKKGERFRDVDQMVSFAIDPGNTPKGSRSFYSA